MDGVGGEVRSRHRKGTAEILFAVLIRRDGCVGSCSVNNIIRVWSEKDSDRQSQTGGRAGGREVNSFRPFDDDDVNARAFVIGLTRKTCTRIAPPSRSWYIAARRRLFMEKNIYIIIIFCKGARVLCIFILFLSRFRCSASVLFSSSAQSPRDRRRRRQHHGTLDETGCARDKGVYVRARVCDTSGVTRWRATTVRTHTLLLYTHARRGLCMCPSVCPCVCVCVCPCSCVCV